MARSPHTLRISSRSGRVDVVAEDRHDIVVEGAETDIEDDGTCSTTTASTRSDRIRARVPTGTDIIIGTTSGACRIEGHAGRAVVSTSSGKVVIEMATEVDVRVASGSIRIGVCEGSCCVQCASGRVEIGCCGSADINNVSGKVSVNDARGPMNVRVVNGEVSVALDGNHDADVESISGKVTIGVPHHTRVHLEASSETGKVRNHAEQGDDCTLRIRTVTGNITVEPV